MEKVLITRTVDLGRSGRRFVYTLAYKGHTMQARTAAHAKNLAGWLKRQVDLEESESK